MENDVDIGAFDGWGGFKVYMLVYLLRIHGLAFASLGFVFLGFWIVGF